MQNRSAFDDREFFLENPKREFRLRPALPGEFSAEEFTVEQLNEETEMFVLVMKITGNERLRIPITMIVDSEVDDPKFQSDDSTCNELLKAIASEVSFQELKEYYPTDIDTIH
ncbi:MAG: hypothetical protein ACR2OW_12390 [Methyloligellaceae bacterium]